MNATDLQKLRREVELAQKHGTTPDISAWDLFEVLNIAERAVSPAESVLPTLPEKWPHYTGSDYSSSQMRDYALAAHAEGRRSALEELHPQWLKEKERADKAEAKLHDVHAKANAWSIRAEKAEADAAMWAKRYSDALNAAARKGPDLSDNQIMALWTQCNMPSEENDFITGPLPFARALLSSTAQPLQQEGGKDSMPVEQEPKYGIRNGFLFNRASGEYIPADEPVFIFRARDWHAVNILAGYAGEVTDKDHAAAVWKRVDDFKRFWNAHPERMKQPDTAPQPSDNLQQASTAQAEPVKEDTFETGYKNLVFVLRCIASGHHNSEELARNVLKHGLLPDTAATPEGDEFTIADRDHGLNELLNLAADMVKGNANMDTAMLFEQHLESVLARLAATTAAEPVAMADVLAAIRTVDKEAERRGGMFPQDADEHRADRRAVQRVLGMLEWYGDRQQCEKWKEWPRRAAPPQQVDTGGLPG